MKINDVEEKTKQNYKQVPEKEQKGDKSDNNQSDEKCKQAAEMEKRKRKVIIQITTNQMKRVSRQLKWK